jgi:hypothetical protein
MEEVEQFEDISIEDLAEGEVGVALDQRMALMNLKSCQRTLPDMSCSLMRSSTRMGVNPSLWFSSTGPQCQVKSVC